MQLALFGASGKTVVGSFSRGSRGGTRSPPPFATGAGWTFDTSDCVELLAVLDRAAGAGARRADRPALRERPRTGARRGARRRRESRRPRAAPADRRAPRGARVLTLYGLGAIWADGDGDRQVHRSGSRGDPRSRPLHRSLRNHGGPARPGAGGPRDAAGTLSQPRLVQVGQGSNDTRRRRESGGHPPASGQRPGI